MIGYKIVYCVNPERLETIGKTVNSYENNSNVCKGCFWRQSHKS